MKNLRMKLMKNQFPIFHPTVVCRKRNFNYFKGEVIEGEKLVILNSQNKNMKLMTSYFLIII